MRKILIVGAGQAGLQLALGLVTEGYDVTVMSARTPDEIRTGQVMSTQCMFGPSLQTERDHGLNLWESRAPRITGLNVTVTSSPGKAAFSFVGPLKDYAQSVDQRLKMAGWLELLQERGGKVVHHPVAASDLEDLTELYDLTIIAAGKGELVELFDREPTRSPYDRPQRMLSVIYVHGMTPLADHPEPHVSITAIPGVGELFTMPCYTLTGPCEILFFEGVPGGPLDCWGDQPKPDEHLKRTLQLMQEYAPWVYDRCRDGVEPTDARSTLIGGYPPIVRHPVGRPSGSAAVLGMADVVVANDPLAGQGSNNAAHCAAIYLRCILEHGDRPFDPEWMQATFDAYWDYAQHSTNYTNAMLGPMPEHVQRVLATAAEVPAVARRFASGYADPTDFANWLMDPDATDAYLRSVADGLEGTTQ